MIYTQKWETLKSTDRHNWLVGAILSIAESISKQRRDEAYRWITHRFRSTLELQKYMHELEEQS